MKLSRLIEVPVPSLIDEGPCRKILDSEFIGLVGSGRFTTGTYLQPPFLPSQLHQVARNSEATVPYILDILAFATLP